MRSGLAEAILRSLARAVIATDEAGIVQYWNPAAEALYGWTAEEAIGRPILDLVVPDLAAGDATRIVEQVAGGRGAWQGDFVARHRDGTPIRIRVGNQPLLDAAGTVIGVVGESEDVTRQRAIEEDLQVSNDRWRLALQAGQLGTFQWDLRTGVTFWDERHEALFGLAPGTFPGVFQAWLDLVHPDDAARTERTIRRALAEARPYEVAHRVVWSDGSVHWLEGRGEPQVDDHGAVIGVIGCTADVTVRQETAARLSGLQAVTAGLATATTAAEVVAMIVAEGSAVLGGTVGSLCLLSADGETFELVKEVGLGRKMAESWRTFPASARVPAADAVRENRAVVLTSVADRDRQYPAFAGVPTAAESFVTIPLVLLNGRPLGAFTIGFPTARVFDADELEFLESLGELSAQAIQRASLFEETRAARLDAERASARLGLLADASGVLSSSLEQDEALAALVDVIVPALADACVIALFDDRGGLVPVVRAGRSELEPVVDPQLLEHHDGSTTVVPLRARGRVLGVLALANDTRTRRTLSDDDLVLARELGERGALAIDRARLFEDRSRVAATLQASLLPPTLPDVDGLELGAVYVAAGAGTEVGGDFYDAFALDRDRWFFTIGDVRGKGIEAAEVTSLARHTIRSAAVTDADPASVLRHLNEMLLRSFEHGDVDPRFCTVVAGVLERSSAGFRLTTCAGGHPLPVLWSEGSASEIGTSGTVLGVVPEVDLQSVTTDLARGDVVVLYTDGVSERRDGSRFFETEGLMAALPTGTGHGAKAIATGIEAAVRGYAAEPPSDDMAILVLRVP